MKRTQFIACSLEWGLIAWTIQAVKIMLSWIQFFLPRNTLQEETKAILQKTSVSHFK